ncbi:Uncharacterized protein GBIM_20873 [Gryllus bimaculatus]|nr:Uncharacterized protein GBIM_20873 [Gryllus bimaculatus]
MSTAGTKMVTCSLEAEVPAVESRSGRRWGRVLKARAILRLAGAAGRGRRLLLAVTASVRLLAAPLPLSAYSNASAAWTLALSALDAGTSAHFFFSHPISVGTARQTPCGGRFNSEGDSAWVERELVPALEMKAGLRLCLLQRDFSLGSPSLHNFSLAVCASGCVLAVLSHHFLENQWGLWQLEQASRQTRRHQRLVLLERERLARAAAPQHVRFLMDTRTYLPWTGSLARAGALERLAAALAPFPLSHAGARCHVAFARR